MKKPVKTKKVEKEKKYCCNCLFSQWFDVYWNRSVVDNKPITMHCNFPSHPLKGLFKNTIACDDYVKKI